MNVFTRQYFSLAKIPLPGKSSLYLTLSCVLLFPVQLQADLVYGTVAGVTPDNLTLIVYKGDDMVTSAAIRSVGNNQYEYQLNLPPGTYKIKYKETSQLIVNYPGTNRVNVNYSK